jgi:hypothetical protein
VRGKRGKSSGARAEKISKDRTSAPSFGHLLLGPLYFCLGRHALGANLQIVFKYNETINTL